jgi:hypothetical protein
VNVHPQLKSLIEELTGSDFKSVSPLPADQKRMADTSASDEGRKAAMAAHRLFESSDDFRLVLEHLKSVTVGRFAFTTELGIPADQIAVVGAFREGQNSLFAYACKLISEGGKPPASTSPEQKHAST